MDESLVLLKNLLCWNDEDIVVLTNNARESKYKRKMTSAELNKLRNYNFADTKIYNHFNNK